MACALILPLGATLAWAQTAIDERLIASPVQERVPVELIPEGRAYKGFVFFPELTVEGTYNDNIFSSDGNEEQDYIINTVPRLRVVKRYGSNSFEFDAAGLFQRYLDNKDEDLDLFSLSTAGQITVYDMAEILYDASLNTGVVTRQTPGESQFTIEPVKSRTAEGSLGIAKRFNRLKLALIGQANRKTFEDGTSRLTGLPVVFRDRNRNTYRAELSAFYDFLGVSRDEAEHTLFGRLSYQQQKFDAPSAGNVSSDNSEIGFLAGIQTRYKGLIFGRLGLGYFSRDFDNVEDVSRFDIDANIAFNVTPKLTLSLLASRNLEQDNSFVTGFLETQGTVGFDYELQHDWYVGSALTYKDREFLGDQSGREDDVIESKIFTRYIHSRYLESQLEFARSVRNSNALNSDYDQNIIRYSLTGRL